MAGCLTAAPTSACAAPPKSLTRMPISGLTASVLRAAVSTSRSPAASSRGAGATRRFVVFAVVRFRAEGLFAAAGASVFFTMIVSRDGEAQAPPTSIARLSAIKAGLASPSISTVLTSLISLRPSPLSVTSASVMRLRTRAPAFTGARKRTLSRP